MSELRRKEKLRDKVLAVLAAIHPTRWTEQDLMDDFGARLGYTPDEMRSALAFRVGLGHLEESVHGSGATKYYAATPAGLLAAERGE